LFELDSAKIGKNSVYKAIKIDGESIVDMIDKY